MSRKIAVGFVIYGPEENFLVRLKEVVTQDFDIYIFDNSPWNDAVREYSVNEKNIKYLTVGKNVGLGFGMSSVCAQAFYAGNSTLLFFDQDTVFSHKTLAFIENYYLNNLNLENMYSAVVFNSRYTTANEQQNCFQDVDMAINSGSLFFLKNLKDMGWHNEKYFVDCVDYEFCLKSQKLGLRIGAYMCTPGFDHSSEQADKKYKFFGELYPLRAYPLFRIKDTCKASVKLIVTALYLGKFKFAAKVGRLIFIYFIFQIAARILNPVSIK